MSGPRNRARTIEALVAVLLPGDTDFPSGAEAGVQTKLVERLADLEGDAAVDQMIAAVNGLADSPAGERRSIVEAFERDFPALFGTVRNHCYLAYYENPFVQEAIRLLGFAYNAAPLPKGYGVRRFDMAKDVPTHGRGRYMPTDAVERVDLSGLDIKELSSGQ